MNQTENPRNSKWKLRVNVVDEEELEWEDICGVTSLESELMLIPSWLPYKGTANRVASINKVLLYVQEVVTLQKKYLIYLHQKMRFTPVINYYNTLG